MENIKSLKGFIEKSGFKYGLIYANANKYLGIMKKAYENYQNNKTFECSEEKLLKILNVFKSFSKINFSSIEMICKYLNEDELKNIEPLKINDNILEELNKEELKKIKKELIAKNTYRKNKGKQKFEFLWLLINSLEINWERRKNILTDNSINLKKLFYIKNPDELSAIINDEVLFSILKKIPLKAVEKLSKLAIKNLKN